MDRKPKSSGAKPKRVIDIANVTQIDVLEEYQLLLILATKSLMSLPLEVLDANDNQSQLLRRPKKIQNHANFFKAGVCMGRHLVCSAKMSGISTTIKVFEPSDTLSKNKKKPAIGRMFQGNQDTLKPFKVRLSSPYILGLSLRAPVLTRTCTKYDFRNSMYPPNPLRSTSSAVNSVWHVLVALKLSASRHWKRNHYSIMPIHLSISSIPKTWCQYPLSG